MPKRSDVERVIGSSLLLEGERLPIWWQSGDRVIARAMLARALRLQGFAERAHNETRASLDELQSADDKVTICRVLYYGICRIAPMTGDFAAAESAIARLVEEATSLNARFWMTAGQFLQGKLMIARGEFADRLALLCAAFTTCSETGWRLSYPEFSGSLALALAPYRADSGQENGPGAGLGLVRDARRPSSGDPPPARDL